MADSLTNGWGAQTARSQSGSGAGASKEQTGGQETGVQIDARKSVGAFPHYWESVVGSGRAVLALRAAYRDDLRLVHDQTGMERVRFHGIFNRENGVCRLDPRGDVVYNFQYVDQIYDGLLEAGVRPFVELSFMPPAIASGNKTVFWYKANVTPPKDMADWVQLVTTFARHLSDRYGAEELGHWFFEVWNEPNLDFWSGTQEQYFELYRHTATALKSVDKRLQVGGPATAEASWAPEFIDYCVKQNAPVDFLSTHIYANDPQNKVFGRETNYSLDDVIPLALQKVRNQVASSEMPHLPIYITEWNSTFMNDSAITDTSFNAAFIVNTLNRCQGLVDLMSYWCFSDVFEEQGVAQNIFYGGYGLIAMRRIPKPSFHAFTLLHRMGNERYETDEGPVIATRRADGSLAILVWNLTPRDAHGNPEKGQPLSLRLVVRGLGSRNKLAITRVDESHGSALPAYREMGSPQYPTSRQVQDLRRAAQLPSPQTSLVAGGKLTEIPVELPPSGIALLEVSS
ncbi:MAG TPA: glycosyl hydrolase family 39 [Terriglobia bacterium]|nr:glycosyl hydrolase family 39 [Terriglobia bacterium]